MELKDLENKYKDDLTSKGYLFRLVNFIDQNCLCDEILTSKEYKLAVSYIKNCGCGGNCACQEIT